jgi:hypothetical protein
MIEIGLFAIVALLAVYLLAPAFRAMAPPRADPRVSLEAARLAALRGLRDLELDWATGKLSEEDYRSQRAALEAEAAATLRRQAEGGGTA